MSVVIPPDFFAHFRGSFKADPSAFGVLRVEHADGRIAELHAFDNWMQVTFPDGTVERYEDVMVDREALLNIKIDI